MLCIHSWFIWRCISCFRHHEKPGKNNVKWKQSFLDFGTILGEGWLAKNYIYHCYSCLDSSTLWTLNFTMYYELCNPKVGVVLPNWRSESQGAIYPYEWCSYYELRASRGGNEGGNRQSSSILKAGLHLGPDCGLWVLCPVSMETNWKIRSHPPTMEEPHGSYLDFCTPKRIP